MIFDSSTSNSNSITNKREDVGIDSCNYHLID